MQAVKGIKPMVKLQTLKTEVTALEANNLAQTLHEFREVNGAVSESIARWMAKNLKKLKPIVERTNNLHKTIFDEYVEKDGDKSIFWNYNETSPKAILNSQMLYSIEDGKPIPGNVANSYKPYVAGEERKKEFDDKRKSADEEKHPVFVEQLNIELLANVSVPTQIDIVALYDVLTFDSETVSDEPKSAE